jgi:SnoaL-like domain
MNDVSGNNPLKPSTDKQVAEIMAVPNKPGYTDAFVKIASTIAREAFAMDKQDWTLLVAQYTEDAVFETSADFGTLPEEVRKLLDRGVRGHAAIVEYVKVAGGFAYLPPGMWNQHVYTNLWLEKYDGKTALARGYVAGLGRLEQDYRLCADGNWRITRKKIIANAFPPRQPTMPAEWVNPQK